MTLQTAVAALVGLLLALPVRAQLVVRVTSGGYGLAGAEVAVWSDSGRVAAGRSDGGGTVRLILPRPRARGLTVAVRRLGHAPTQRVLGDADTVSVALAAVPGTLPALAVSARVLRCPLASEASAEALWRAAAGRYARGQERLFFGYVDLSGEERVAAESRGYGEELEKRRMGMAMSLDERSLAALMVPPYATSARRRDISGESTRWLYAELEDRQASHFASEAFGARHAFTVLGSSDGSTVLGFCPRDGEAPAIEGEIRIDADTVMRAARWQFRVPRDDDDAGGEVAFGTARLDGQSYLIAIRGSSWRRADRGFYEQRRFERVGWRFGRTRDAAETGWAGRGDLGHDEPPTARTP
ncbi:MAG: hypothetical protein JWL60_2667 [Gemmatimonadetes bacterium]|nr:hypothetical protein [Gemmatimonadota bacterium]